MPINIIEEVQNATVERPLKGLMLENGIHVFDTKQEILDQQTLAKGRVAGGIIFARDVKKFLIFDDTGDTYNEKDIPAGLDLSDYVKKNSNAELNKVSVNGIRGSTAYNNFTIKGSSDGGDDGDGLIFKTYIRADQNPNKDYIQYFGGTGGGNQLANTESVSAAIAEDKAKGEWIGGVFKDTINDDGNPEDDFTCNDPKQWLEYRKTAFNGAFALTVNQGQSLISSEIVIHLHITSGMTSAPFKVVTNDGKEVTRTIRVGEKWRFYLRTGATPYFELIDDGMQSGSTDSDYDGEGFGVPGRTETGHGTIVQRVVTGNYRNTSSETGDLVINLRTDDGVKNFRFYYSLPHGTLASGRKVYVKVDEKAGNNKTIRAGEIWQCEIKAGQFFDDFFWQKITDGSSTFVLEEDFNSKSGYGALVSGGGSSKTITYLDNATILKISNSTVKVEMLAGMNGEDKKHGYFKYINTKNDDVSFEWYDRGGIRISNNVPNTCPANVVVEVFADYEKNEYVLTFSESKIVATANEEMQLFAGIAGGKLFVNDIKVG